MRNGDERRARRFPSPRSGELHAAEEDPVALLEKQSVGRVPELIPVRYGRMLISPFTFYRGAALVMAADLANGPAFSQ